MATIEQFDAAFFREAAQHYPVIDDVEARAGYAVERPLLEATARVLACPVKANPPSWQHGRVIYAKARAYLATKPSRPLFLDIGTAKGFSACVASWALDDSGVAGSVVSIDIVDPEARVKRNTVAEVGGLRTVREVAAPFISRRVGVSFVGGGSAPWLAAAVRDGVRVNFAFVDGKHSTEAVRAEVQALAQLQRPGDVAIYDDMQIEPVARAVAEMRGYDVERVDTGAGRAYAVAVKR